MSIGSTLVPAIFTPSSRRSGRPGLRSDLAHLGKVHQVQKLVGVDYWTMIVGYRACILRGLD